MSQTQMNFNSTGLTALTALSKATTLGSILTEIKQERILRNHEDLQDKWDTEAVKMNQQYFKD